MIKSEPLVRADTIHKQAKDVSCLLYRAINGSPESNVIKVVELMGGIEKIIGYYDVVIIKPNVQWWNQGAPNLLALKTFVDLIMNRPGGGFDGEVIIAENCHRGKAPWNSPGWIHIFLRNSDIPGIKNFNQLCSCLKDHYSSQFSTVHWVDAAQNDGRIYSPDDGDGYIYCDGTKGMSLLKCDNSVKGTGYRETIMTYPIFRTDKGTIVDFKHGIWEKGAYTDQPLRFINFAALNHHSTYCGATSAVKNYMGISDLSGGPDPHNGGILTDNYYNFHSFPFDKWKPGPQRGMLGRAIGTFMKTVRKADLNITTAEWIGLSSRTEPPVAHTRAVVASTDPVALDYHATKYILYPNSKIPVHNPDDKERPLYQYLLKCAESGECIFDEAAVQIISYDFKKKTIQENEDLNIYGDELWGRGIKDILKYTYLRYFS